MTDNLSMFRGNRNVFSGNETPNSTYGNQVANSTISPQQSMPPNESKNVTTPIPSMVFTRNVNKLDQCGQSDEVSLAEASLLSKMTNRNLVNEDGLIPDQNDPTSPLYSVKSFKDLQLCPELIQSKTQSSHSCYLFRIMNDAFTRHFPHGLSKAKQNTRDRITTSSWKSTR